MLGGKIKADVAIEFSIGGIARITPFGAPNLLARIAIPRKRSRSGGGVTRRKDGALRAWLAKHQPCESRTNQRIFASCRIDSIAGA